MGVSVFLLYNSLWGDELPSAAIMVRVQEKCSKRQEMEAFNLLKSELRNIHNATTTTVLWVKQPYSLSESKGGRFKNKQTCFSM